MNNSGYSTITQYSPFQAMGPFLFTAKNQRSGNLAFAQSSVRITWSTGTVSLRNEILLTQSVKKQPAWEVNHYEDLMDTAYATMLASEAVLSRDWDSPEEDEAWADL